MCHNCLNSETHLLLNPDNDNACKCSCKLTWIDVVRDAFTYGSERAYTTNIKCSQCRHYGIISGVVNSVKEANVNE